MRRQLELTVALSWSLLLFSCAGQAILYTDTNFRTAAPEIVSAWKELAPWHNAQTISLAAGDSAGLLTAVKNAPPGSSALIGFLLSPEARLDLVKHNQQVHFVFFGSGIAGSTLITVNRGQAWALVAQRVSSELPQASRATVLFPADVTPDEVAQFSAAWNQSPGRSIDEFVWPLSVALPPQGGPVFQWVGIEAEAMMQTLEASRSVSGDPANAGRQGSLGWTWRIRRDGLGDFLWKAALETSAKTEFLPLETLSIRR